MRIVALLCNDVRMPGIDVYCHKKYSGRDLVNLTKGADITFIQYQRQDQVSISAIKKMDGFKIAWTGDVRGDIEDWQVDISEVFDLMTFVSMKNVRQMRKHAPADWLNIWYETEVYRPTGRQKSFELVFMANNYPRFPLSNYRESLVRDMKSIYGNRFKVFGSRWHGMEDGNLNNDRELENDYYNRAMMGLNISNYIHEGYSSDRQLRIMGSGCLCLTHDYPAMPFEDWKEVVVWKNFHDLKAKFEYLREKPELCQDIAQRGHERVRDRFATDNFKDNLIDLYEKRCK